MNFLEEFVAEWYQYRGYFVLRNLKFGKREKGGWSGEIDILALCPRNMALRHIEVDGSAEGPAAIKDRMLKKKFVLSKQDYQDLLGMKLSAEVGKRVYFSFSRHPKIDLRTEAWGGIKVITIPRFFDKLGVVFRETPPARATVPESLPLLRAAQFAIYYERTR